MEKLIVEAPLNSLSLGQVSYGILKSLQKRGIKVLYLPIGNSDLSSCAPTEDFKLWLQIANNNFLKYFHRDIPTWKIWHCSGSHHFPSNRRYLLTFHETDEATAEEINIVKNTDKTFFCGEYSRGVFEEYGLTNIDSFNLGFDNDEFKKANKNKYEDGRINWFLGGKAEGRKSTFRLLKLWVDKYGLQPGQPWEDKKRHFLNCAITNPFFQDQQSRAFFQQQIHEALGGKRYYNVQFFDIIPTNGEYNNLLNETDIDITGMSSAESWNLPAFQVSALGGRSIVLNATGHKSWANEQNCILVNPSSKRPIYDNIFFKRGAPFSQGNCFDFNDEDFIAAMDRASELAGTPNVEGEKLGTDFTYDKTVDYVLGKM